MLEHPSADDTCGEVMPICHAVANASKNWSSEQQMERFCGVEIVLTRFAALRNMSGTSGSSKSQAVKPVVPCRRNLVLYNRKGSMI
jgi:hypothetical protein